MYITQIQFISKSAGKSSRKLRWWLLFAAVGLFVSEPALASLQFSGGWKQFERATHTKERSDYVNGLSYIISGSIGLVGGQLGQTTTDDPFEKGVYTMFQSIGIASIAFGVYTWKIGDEDRLIYKSLEAAGSLSDKDREAFLASYIASRREREKNERFVKLIAHSLIAAFNIYSATQQEEDSVRNGLYFIGGVNALAAITFTF